MTEIKFKPEHLNKIHKVRIPKIFNTLTINTNRDYTQAQLQKFMKYEETHFLFDVEDVEVSSISIFTDENIKVLNNEMESLWSDAEKLGMITDIKNELSQSTEELLQMLIDKTDTKVINVNDTRHIDMIDQRDTNLIELDKDFDDLLIQLDELNVIEYADDLAKLSLKELRILYPDIKATSQKKFLELLNYI